MITLTRTEIESAEALLTEQFKSGELPAEQYMSLMEDIAVITRGRKG